ncbi:MAG: L-threonylcarbamoyladenylate synthase [Deltaproteobacteria bacterium]|nr:L-threonylcarbamoyladenylate synthase [Deltaproteobacteria bacterium]MCL5277934.1 L-threonylcarbamoyladenylate synthase [Deltaproteobacteria bacterium]
MEGKSLPVPAPMSGLPYHILRVGDVLKDKVKIGLIADSLRSGRLMLYPTETVYGIGCDAFSDAAVERVSRIKLRAQNRPLILLVRDMDMLRSLAAEVPPVAERLIGAFWPGALTLVFTARSGISSMLTAGTGRLGLRLSPHPLIKSIFGVYDHPLVSTSANRTGEEPVRSIPDAPRSLIDKIDLVIDGGMISAAPSTVIDVTGKEVRCLREGMIKKAEIERVVYDRDKAVHGNEIQ